MRTQQCGRSPWLYGDLPACFIHQTGGSIQADWFFGVIVEFCSLYAACGCKYVVRPLGPETRMSTKGDEKGCITFRARILLSRKNSEHVSDAMSREGKSTHEEKSTSDKSTGNYSISPPKPGEQVLRLWELERPMECVVSTQNAGGRVGVAMHVVPRSSV